MSALLADGLPRTITVPNGDAQVLAGQIPQVGRFVVESVVASIDASAAGDVTPELTILDPSGVVIATKQQTKPVAGGTTGTATWALRLTDEQAAAIAGEAPYAWARITPIDLPNGIFQRPFTSISTNAPTVFAINQNGNGEFDILAPGTYRVDMGCVARSSVAHPNANFRTEFTIAQPRILAGTAGAFPGYVSQAFGTGTVATDATWEQNNTTVLLVDPASVGGVFDNQFQNNTSNTLHVGLQDVLVTKLSDAYV